MATSIYATERTAMGYVFHTTDTCALIVKDYRGGIARIEPPSGVTIESLAHTIAGCFKTRSNFPIQLERTFGDETPFKGICFELGGAHLLVTHENSKKEQICQEWQSVMHKT